MNILNKRHAKRVILASGIGALGLTVAILTPVFIPCLFKWITGIPCPACGFTRALILASQLYVFEAVKTNILFMPLAIGTIIYFICSLIDLFSDRCTIKRLNKAMANKWVITFAVLYMVFSWYYNITHMM